MNSEATEKKSTIPSFYFCCIIYTCKPPLPLYCVCGGSLNSGWVTGSRYLNCKCMWVDLVQFLNPLHTASQVRPEYLRLCHSRCQEVLINVGASRYLRYIKKLCRVGRIWCDISLVDTWYKFQAISAAKTLKVCCILSCLLSDVAVLN